MNDQSIRPNLATLVIGVGGIGGRMVQRLREYFIDCVPARRSSVSFLYVDIDEDAPPLDACSPLKSDEVILLRRPTSSADITHSNELGNPSSRSFTEEINSQVINTSFVPPRIGSLISSIMQPDSRLNDVLGTFARGDKNVFVIGSFVGTTGSALILALPRLIRNICRGNTPHVGAIVLPPPAFGFPESIDGRRADAQAQWAATAAASERELGNQRSRYALDELRVVDPRSQLPDEEQPYLDAVLAALSDAGIPVGERLPLFVPTRDQLRAARIQLVEINDDLIHQLARYPSLMYELDPRKFEELVATVWRRFGCDVTLTRRTRDGGKDVYAVESGPAGRLLYVIECKRFSPERPVRVEIVRSLYGVTQRERATKGIIATTSYFTRDAIEFQSTLEYQLELAGFNDLSLWLRRLSK